MLCPIFNLRKAISLLKIYHLYIYSILVSVQLFSHI